MSERQSDNFDEWFRQAAEQHEPPFNEAAWEKMEARLDGKDRRRRPFFWWWLADLLMIGLMTGILLAGNRTQSDSNHITQQSTIQTTLLKQAPTEVPSIASATTVDHKINQSPGSTATAFTTTQSSATKPTKEVSNRPLIDKTSVEEPTGSQAVTVDAPVLQRKKGRKYTENKLPIASSGEDRKHDKSESLFAVNIQNGTITKRSKQRRQDGLNKTVVEPVNVDELSSSGVITQTAISEKAADNRAEPAPVITVAKVDSTITSSTLKDSILKRGNTDKKELLKKNKQNPNGIFLFAAAGPEWSFVFGNNTGRTTFAYGGGVGYRLNKHWAVTAGAFVTRKKYAAGGSDYKATPGSYYANVKINKVDATCGITEIPVAVRYYFKEKRKQTFFVSIGLSSLIMNSEDYAYDYIRMNGQQAYSSHEYSTGKGEWFSAAMLSAGYVRPIGARLSVSAEPYIKLPLYGVGEGKVKLGSAGLLIGLQYSLK